MLSEGFKAILLLFRIRHMIFDCFRTAGRRLCYRTAVNSYQFKIHTIRLSKGGYFFPH